MQVTSLIVGRTFGGYQAVNCTQGSSQRHVPSPLRASVDLAKEPSFSR